MGWFDYYPCPDCGKACSSVEEASAHCASWRRNRGAGRNSDYPTSFGIFGTPSTVKCTTCNGSGRITHFFGPDEVCPDCNGSGKL